MKKYFFILICYSSIALSQSIPNYSVFGVFNLQKTKYYDTTFTNLSTNNSVAAYFTYTPSAAIFMEVRNSAGSLQFNNTNLNYDTLGKFYSHTSLSSLDTQSWTVAGAGEIDEMDFEYEGSIPTFSIHAQLLGDTLKKSDTLFITIDNIQETDSITIFFSDNPNGNTVNTAIFKAPNYTNTYYIIPSVFENLQVGSNAYMKIEASNYSYQTISDKQFLFRNIYCYTRSKITVVN